LYLKELDSISHISFDGKFLQGTGLTKGSEGITADGESIKAGKFPVLFYINNAEVQRLHKFKVSKRNSKMLLKYNNRGRDLQNTVSGSRSVSTQGNNNSD
jgi:hypothetical protein